MPVTFAVHADIDICVDTADEDPPTIRATAVLTPMTNQVSARFMTGFLPSIMAASGSDDSASIDTGWHGGWTHQGKH
jgi:hypothetical protein